MIGRPGLLGRVRRLAMRHPLPAVCLPLFVGLAVQPLTRGHSEFMDAFVRVSGLLVGGQDLYAGGTGFMYPPFAALIAVPFVPLPEHLARLLWYFVNVGAIYWLIRSAWIMAGGPRLGSVADTAKREWVAFWLGMLWIAPYLLNALAHEQTDILIDAALTTGCWLILRGRPSSAGLLLGLSASFKGPTLLFLGYLLFRRQWRVAAVAFAVVLGLNLVPDLIAWQWPGTYLLEWVHRIVVPAESIQAPLGSWNAITTTYALANQSLAGTLQRLANSTVIWTSGVPGFAARAEPIGTYAMKITAYLLMLLMAAVSAWAALRGDSKPQGRGAAGDLPSRRAIEFGSMFILILMMSPMSALAHCGLLALPVLCFARLAVGHGNRLAWLIVAIGIASALSVNKDLVGRTAFYLAMWAGVTTFAAALLWLGTVVVLAGGRMPDRFRPPPLGGRARA